MSRSGEKTQQKILSTATRLFASRGIDGVSLREINREAGQRNTNALRYHFGDRDGLLVALAQPHMRAVDARREVLYRQAETANRLGEIECLVELLVRPLAEYAHEGPTEREWVRVAAELASHPRTNPERFESDAPPVAFAVALALYHQLATRTTPALAAHRLRAVSECALHVVASRARMQGDPDLAETLLPFELFLADLLQSMTAAIDAPFAATTSAEDAAQALS